MMRLFYIILVLILLPNLFCGQWEYSYRNINISDGLPSNTIYDVAQVSDGSILIGHEKGLSRFNGVSFQHFECDKQISLSNIIELEQGKYLCRSFNDDCYITEGLHLHRQETLSKKEFFFSNYLKLKDNSVIKISSSAVSRIWDGKKQVFEELLNFKNDSLHIFSYSVLNNQLLINQSTSFLIYDLNNGLLVNSFQITLEPKTICFQYNNEFFILGTTSGNFWSINENGDLSKSELIDYNNNDKFSCIGTIQDSILAIGTFGGLYLYDKNFNLISKALVGKQITCIEEDVEGNLWVGTQLEGLLVIPSLQIKQIQEEFFSINKFAISNTITISDTLIIAGSYDGRVAFFSEKGVLVKLLDLDVKSEVQALYFDANRNSLYVDCLNLYEIDIHSYHIKSQYKSRSVKDLLVKKDTLYMATSVGVHVGKNAGSYIIHNLNVWYNSIVEFQDGFLIESLDGLYKMENNTLSLLHEDFIGESDKKVLFIKGLNQSSGRITFAKGGKVYEIVDDEVFQVFEVEGFKIKELVASKSKIWATDGSKIYEYRAHNIVEINETKGLTVSDIRKLVVLQEKLLIVGIHNLQWIEENLKTNNQKPNLKAVNIKGSYEWSNEKLTSDFEDNLLEIHFEILPNISSLGKDKILYRIPNVVPEWTEVIHSKLILERLPYGIYNIEVVGYNEDGIASNILTIPIVIKPPFYSTWWFRTSMIFITIGVLIFILKWRIRIVEQKNTKELQTAQLKAKAIQSELKALRSQMNPHFIFNSLSAIQSRILNGESRGAYEHLNTFSSLLRQSLKFTSKEFITIEEEISFLKDYITLEQSRSDGSFDFRIELDKKMQISKILFPSLLSQPFVENAIRHGLMNSSGERILKISINGNENNFNFIIEDNGIGRVKSELLNKQRQTKHESYALKAIRDRIEMINRENKMFISLEIEDLTKGTKVIISILKK